MDIITDLITKEHKRIVLMLEKITMLIYENPSKIKESFSVFKWNLEKHLFIEEKAIFQMTSALTGNEVTNVFKLLEEHGDIMSLIKRIEEDLKNNEYNNISELLRLLDEHVHFENETFYPNLDRLLDDNRKKEILERVNEIIKG